MKEEYNQTPLGLEVACANTNTELVKILLNNKDIDIDILRLLSLVQTVICI